MPDQPADQTQIAAAPLIPKDAAGAIKAWLVEGATIAQVREAIGEHYPNLDADEAMAAVCDDLAADAQTDRTALKGWAMNAYREIYRRALELGDLATALRAAKMLSEL